MMKIRKSMIFARENSVTLQFPSKRQLHAAAAPPHPLIRSQQRLKLNQHLPGHLSLVGAATSIIFVATKLFCSDKHVLIMTKHVFCCHTSMLAVLKLLWQQTWFCHEQNWLLSRQTCVCRDKTCLLLWQKYACQDKTFVATSMLLSQRKMCLSWQKFSRDKNDTCGSPRQW